VWAEVLKDTVGLPERHLSGGNRMQSLTQSIGGDCMNWLTDGFFCGFFGMLFVGLPYLIGSGEL